MEVVEVEAGVQEVNRPVRARLSPPESPGGALGPDARVWTWGGGSTIITATLHCVWTSLAEGSTLDVLRALRARLLRRLSAARPHPAVTSVGRRRGLEI